ncbi:MarR family winged helix-turn-helix transcriptional regulator [Hydrogenophaga sp.]|uniref:MarR family winged helix-turn-helix transcriptional regulator n=1 Tax=Hydrogenophaga sp. TaxID=1904254 RepID=UPI003F70E616
MATRRGNTAVRQGRKVLNLSGYVTFYFTVLANKLSSGASRLYLKRYDIGIIEWRVMAMLAVEPRISPARICQIIGLDKGAVSREMRKLEAKGYLTVEEDPESTRRRTLELTPLGYQIHDEIIRTALERERRLLRGLSTEEVDTLLNLLVRTTANIPFVNEYDPPTESSAAPARRKKA